MATTLTLTPYQTENRSYWYGCAMDNTEENSAGCAFLLSGFIGGATYVVEWRYSSDGFYAYMTTNGSGFRWPLGSPRTLTGLARKVLEKFSGGSTVYRVTAPKTIEMPGEY